jgi:hypothetical protein
VQTVKNARPHHCAGVERFGIARFTGVYGESDLEVLVLRPILENLVGDLDRGSFDSGRQLLVLVDIRQLI